MLEKELTIAVLSQTETLLGFLNTDTVDIQETSEYGGLRTVTITHPLFDVGETDNTKYTDILLPGNKIWRGETCDGVGCLYVILDDPTYDFIGNTIEVKAEEVATELSTFQVYRNDSFSWTVNDAFIATYFNDLFSAGTLTGPGATTATSYSGALTGMAILRKIEEKTGGEFQFRYEYDPTSKQIKRYIDYLTTIGTTHTKPITLSNNALKITLGVNESNVRVAAAPIGEPSNDTDEFHKNMKAFEDQAFSTSVQIPLWVTKDDDGNDLNGPMVYPPYDKAAGENTLVADVSEMVANYNYIRSKERGVTSYPRIQTVETSETNKYNLYWDLVDALREHLEPEITIDNQVVDINKLQDETGEYYNMGDTVYIQIPIFGVISARITATTKDPRRLDSDEITIGNYQTGFIERKNKSAGMVDLTP